MYILITLDSELTGNFNSDVYHTLDLLMILLRRSKHSTR